MPRKILNLREQLPYEIDGMVYKVNRLDWQNRMGSISRSQGGLLRINFRLSRRNPVNTDRYTGYRTGVLTPVRGWSQSK